MRPELHFAENAFYVCHIGLANFHSDYLINKIKSVLLVFKRTVRRICPFNYPQHIFDREITKIILHYALLSGGQV